MVVTDERQHHHQWVHRPDSEGVERGDGRVHTHPLRAHVHGALHAPPREAVSGGPTALGIPAFCVEFNLCSTSAVSNKEIVIMCS